MKPTAGTTERKAAGPWCLHHGPETDAAMRQIKREEEKEMEGDLARGGEAARARQRGREERDRPAARERRREKAAVVFLARLGEIRTRRTNGLTKVSKVGDTQSRGHVLHERTP